jgi:mono/diheme cytochrome c family protein
MKRFSSGHLFAIVLSLSVFFAIAIPPALSSSNSTVQDVSSGKRIFSQYCSGCHDTNGAVGTSIRSGPSLKNYYHRRPRPSDTTVRTIIQQGEGTMPAFSTLDRLQTADLIAYLKTL